MSETVLVVGGAGYIGSHACKALARAGFRPVCLDSLVSGHPWAVKWGPLERGDLRDSGFLDVVFQRHRPQSVLHFGALSNVPEAEAHPQTCLEVNVEGTRSLLQVMARHGVEHLVFSSTAAVYGIPERFPITEATRKAPISVYGTSKHMAECLMEEAVGHGLKSVALRYFNAAGADPECETGEHHVPETHLLPLLLQTALGRRPHINLFGTDFPTPDGTAIRDYVHVSDLANAHLLALFYLRQRPAGFDVFNLGSGQGYSCWDMIRCAREVSQRTIPVVESPRREGDPPMLVADSSRARAVLGWAPRWSKLEDIVSHAWAWEMSKPTD